MLPSCHIHLSNVDKGRCQTLAVVTRSRVAPGVAPSCFQWLLVARSRALEAVARRRLVISGVTAPPPTTCRLYVGSGGQMRLERLRFQGPQDRCKPEPSLFVLTKRHETSPLEQSTPSVLTRLIHQITYNTDAKSPISADIRCSRVPPNTSSLGLSTPPPKPARCLVRHA